MKKWVTESNQYGCSLIISEVSLIGIYIFHWSLSVNFQFHEMRLKWKFSDNQWKSLLILFGDPILSICETVKIQEFLSYYLNMNQWKVGHWLAVTSSLKSSSEFWVILVNFNEIIITSVKSLTLIWFSDPFESMKSHWFKFRKDKE